MAAGCAKSNPLGEIKYVPVEGVVTQNGEPAVNVKVTFRPKIVRPDMLDESIGTTDAEGKFSIKTGEENGCPEGDYFVGFSQFDGTTEMLTQYCRPMSSGFSIVVSADMETPAFDLK